MPAAFEALPAKTIAQLSCIIPCAFQKDETFSSARAASSCACYPEATRTDSERAVKEAREIGQAATLMHLLCHAPLINILRGNYAAASDLPGYQSEPGAEVTSAGEHRTAADRGDHRAGDDRSNAGHRHQPLASGILAGDDFNLAG